MFKPFEQLETKADENQLFAYVDDAIKHLRILQNNCAASNSVAQISKELGFINNLDSFNEFAKLAEKKLKITTDELSSLLACINHKDDICILPKICTTCREALQLQEKQSDKPTIVDLFCGAGGMSLGFSQAGYRIVFANDIEPSCIETYTYNHPEVDPSQVVLGDIQNFALTIQNYTKNEPVSIICGGPPCQGFSLANQQRIIDDPRNKLYKEFVNAVASVRPTFFVMENVVGMKDISAQVIEDFEHVGYKVDFEILNAVDFGVAQQRKRLIFIGNKIDVDNKKIFEEIHAKNTKVAPQTLADAIDDLPELEALKIKNATDYESVATGYLLTDFKNYKPNTYRERLNNGSNPKFLYNHKARYNNDRDIEIFGRLYQGDKSDDPKIADIMPYASRNNIFKDKYFKLIYDQPCKTITAHMKFDCNMYIHPTQARGLTPREAARIQSYPDDYFFKGSFTKTYMQIGNSVPPIMARTIAEAILPYVEAAKLQDEQLKFPLDM